MVILEVTRILIDRLYLHPTDRCRIDREFRQVISPFAYIRDQSIISMLVPVLKKLLPDLEASTKRVTLLCTELHSAMDARLHELNVGIAHGYCPGRCFHCLSRYYGNITQTSLAAFFGHSAPHWVDDSSKSGVQERARTQKAARDAYLATLGPEARLASEENARRKEESRKADARWCWILAMDIEANYTHELRARVESAEVVKKLL